MNTKDQNAAIAKILGTLLKEERANTKTEIDNLAERLNSLDGNILIKTAAVAVADANLAALRTHTENILLRKSNHLAGKLPAVIAGLIK